MVLIIYAVLISFVGWSFGQEHLETEISEKVCQGTTYGVVPLFLEEFPYQQLKDRYTNCTYLVGNLELVFPDAPGKNIDLSFLSTIKQVTGYVLIMGVHADYVPLTSLEIIRGQTLFHDPKTNDDYSLYVKLNYNSSSNIGLEELRFTSLKEILAGKVFFMNNNQLCFENTIDWKDINPHVQPPVVFKFNSTDSRRPCDSCHPSCYSNITHQRHCWGAGEDMCQTLTHGEACHSSCEHRCFGRPPYQCCCHRECAGGCFGPLKTDCLACRNYLNDGACEPVCPPPVVYNSRLMTNVRNPNAKYHYGGLCVRECPGDLLQDAGWCVRTCPDGKHPEDWKNCEPCDGPCPLTCNGTAVSEYLNFVILPRFENCTKIEGSLKILMATFQGDPFYNVSATHPTHLTVLKHVREITGFLQIQSDHLDFTDLSFLSSLEVIGGKELDAGHALHILGTPLKSLELKSLRRIANGNVYILANPHLCYADTVDWSYLFDTQKQTASVGFNRQTSLCEEDGEVCDPQCTREGCWGKGPTNCLKCLMYEIEAEHLCLSNCTDQPLLHHSGDGKCKRCHEQCAISCTGPSNRHCDSCLNVAINGSEGQMTCLQTCPESMFSDEDKICQPDQNNYGSPGGGDNTTVLVLAIVGWLLLLAVVVTGLAYWCHKRVQTKRRTAEGTASLTGSQDMEM